MHESELNRRRKKIQGLLHAAEDMIEAEVAASWRRELDNPHRVRVVTTGMVVAYARPFARTGDYKLNRGEYRPADLALADLHDSLIWWRDKVYGHNDAAGARKVLMTPSDESSERMIGWERKDFPLALRRSHGSVPQAAEPVRG